MTREEVIKEIESQLLRLSLEDLILIHNKFCQIKNWHEDIIYQDVLEHKTMTSDDDKTHNSRCRFGFKRTVGENIDIYYALSEPVVLNAYGNFELADENDIYTEEIGEWIVDNDKFNEFSQLDLDYLAGWDLEEDKKNVEYEKENKDEG